MEIQLSDLMQRQLEKVAELTETTVEQYVTDLIAEDLATFGKIKGIREQLPQE